MSEYPEHIDQIDDFYRSQLADHEIEPPEGLWDKISFSALETTSLETNASDSSMSAGVLFTRTQKIIGLSITSLLIILGALYFYLNKENAAPSQNAIPSTGQPVEEQDSNTSTSENEGSNQKANDAPLKNKTQQPTSINKDEDESTTTNTEVIEKQGDEIKVEIPVITPAAIEEQKADSIADIKATQKVPKEKVKFKDKYKKDYQDSTRKIFVPGK